MCKWLVMLPVVRESGALETQAKISFTMYNTVYMQLYSALSICNNLPGRTPNLFQLKGGGAMLGPRLLNQFSGPTEGVVQLHIYCAVLRKGEFLPASRVCHFLLLSGPHFGRGASRSQCVASEVWSNTNSTVSQNSELYDHYYVFDLPWWHRIFCKIAESTELQGTMLDLS